MFYLKNKNLNNCIMNTYKNKFNKIYINAKHNIKKMKKKNK